MLKKVNHLAMKKIVLLLFGIIILSSCEKDNLNKYRDTPLLSDIYFDRQLCVEYTYNDLCLITEEKAQNYYTKHNYNLKNMLMSSEYYYVINLIYRTGWVNPSNNMAKIQTRLYEYNSEGILTNITDILPTTQPTYLKLYSEFSYEDNRISRQTIYTQNEISSYIDYEYDEKGNMIKETRYNISSEGIGEIWTATEYEFDDKHNPYLAFKNLALPGKYTNPNNITKETYTFYRGIDISSQHKATTYSYEYNSEGYPTKVNGKEVYIYK